MRLVVLCAGTAPLLYPCLLVVIIQYKQESEKDGAKRSEEN